MQMRRCHSWAIASPRLPAVSVLPSPRPGLVISTTLTGDIGSAWRIRVRSARYCSAAVASVDAAVIRRGIEVRAGDHPRRRERLWTPAAAARRERVRRASADRGHRGADASTAAAMREREGPRRVAGAVARRRYAPGGPRLRVRPCRECSECGSSCCSSFAPRPAECASLRRGPAAGTRSRRSRTSCTDRSRYSRAERRTARRGRCRPRRAISITRQRHRLDRLDRAALPGRAR